MLGNKTDVDLLTYDHASNIRGFHFGVFFVCFYFIFFTEKFLQQKCEFVLCVLSYLKTEKKRMYTIPFDIVKI